MKRSEAIICMRATLESMQLRIPDSALDSILESLEDVGMRPPESEAPDGAWELERSLRRPCWLK